MEDIATRAKELGQSAIAITDHGEVNQHIAFYKACRRHDIHPILGMEGYFLPRIEDKAEAPNSHITLLAANQQGLSNLWALSSIAYQRKYFYRKPLTDSDLLRTYADGIFASDGCLLTDFSRAVVDGREDEARQYLATLHGIFGDRFYSELHTWQFIDPQNDEQRRLNAEMAAVNQAKVRLATEMGIPLVVVNDSHHARPEDWENKDLVWKFNTGNKNPDQLLQGEGQKADHIMGSEEIVSWMARHGVRRSVVEEAIRNSADIARACTAEIRPTLDLPRYSDTDRDDMLAFLDLVEKGFRRKVIDAGLDVPTYFARMETEAKLICDKQFCFPAGTQVLTGDGQLVAIEDVREGERVWTRRGAEPVGKTMVREVDEDLTVLGVKGTWRTLKGTGNHPVLTSRGWLEMRDLVPGDEVALDGISGGVDSPLDVLGMMKSAGWKVRQEGEGVVRLGPGRYGVDRAKKGWCPAKLEPSPELMYLIGLWIAEGHLYDPDGKVNPGQVGWTLHRDAHDVRRRLQGALTKLGLGDLRTYPKASACAPDHKGISNMVTNHPLALLLKEVVGDGLHQKRLSPWLMSLSDDSLHHLIRGWSDGDGTTRRVGRNPRRIIDTASALLAYQLRQILLRVGIWATEIRYDNKGRPAYRVCWQESRDKSFYGARWDGERWWAGVRSVEKLPYKGPVYNLSVAGDPTYVAEGIRVHNCGYFLVVHDYVKAAKSGRWAQYVADGRRQPIQVGPGRGSGGGSLVAWLLDITSIDPIRHNLLFERFLSPSRQGYPDIDTDFPRSQRPNMRAYLEARYGHDHVCTIGTIIRNSPKGMVRDLGRAYGLSYSDTEAISKIIMEAAALVADEIEETGEEVSWETVLAEKGGDLRPWVQSHPELFQRLGEMVGIARQSGVHPSGILVNNSPLLGKVPLRTRKHGKPDEVTTTQFSMDEIENDLGGVKFDLLGIRHLDTLDHFRALVRDRHGRDIDFDTLSEAELSDPSLWPRIDLGRTTGIFQVETPGSTRVAKELHPRNVSDLAALVSIVRPGVKDAGLTDVFLRRRMGEETVVYDHPLMEAIVSDTYGILVYQEQLMRAARELARFSAEEADGLRKVTAKKKADEIGLWEDKFIGGCLANPAFVDATPRPRDTAEKIWVSINASARYSFNQAHAVAYALLANWEVFGFAHYEPEMLVALMQTDPAAIPRYVREARRSGISVLPPDINLSDQKFTIVGDTIRYGIDTIRGVGPAAIKAILRARPFVSFDDYLRRVSGYGVSKTVLVNLISVGALDSLGDRRDMLLHLQRRRILESISPNKLAAMSPEQKDELVAKKLTEEPEKWEIPIPDFSDAQVVGKIEEELLGSLVTVDPMAPYTKTLEANAVSHPDEIDRVPVGDTFDVGGQVTKVKEHTIQKQGRSFGRKMAFLTMAWNEEEFEVVAFPDTWDRVKALFVPGSPVLCRAKRTDRGASLEGVYRLDLLFDEVPA